MLGITRLPRPNYQVEELYGKGVGRRANDSLNLTAGATVRGFGQSLAKAAVQAL